MHCSYKITAYMYQFLQGRLILIRLLMLSAAAALVFAGIATMYAIQHPIYDYTTSNPEQVSTYDHQHDWSIETWPSWETWQKQTLFACVGFAAFAAINFFNYRRLGPATYWIYFFVLALLALVLAGRFFDLPFIPKINGSYRWIELPGLPQIQPSEFVKIAYICALAWFLRVRGNYENFLSLAAPFAITLLAMALIILEPDLGTVLLMIPILFAMVFVAGAKPKHLIFIILMAIVVSPMLWSQMESYQRKRVAAVVLQSHWVREKAQQYPAIAQALIGKPNISKIDLNEGYQLLHSKLAIASGGLTGNGYRQGPYLQHNILPERHNDFIFSVIAHQFGFVGSMGLLLLYMIIIACGLAIAAQNPDPFGRLIVIGIVTMITVQVLVNISMTMGLLPCKGVTLPLVSYGGSSLVVMFCAIGLLNSVGRARPYSA